LITTNDDEYAEKLRILRNHGSDAPYRHSVIGFNSRLDEVQAAILRVKMKYIDDFNAGRGRNAGRYNDRLKDTGIITPVDHGLGRHVYHQYTIKSDKRDAIKKALIDKGIACAVYYPVPLHIQPVYESLCEGVLLPNSIAVSGSVLSLPMFPELNEQQIDIVCDTIKGAI
jgi:dTDP-4-amino-4,6-dideoxygalactose transaminase